MALLLFSEKKQQHSVALLDIRETSVGGGYATLVPNQKPTLCYTTRVPVQPHTDESVDDAMLRALTLVSKELAEKGAPLLRKETGDGHPATILASVSVPWQQSRVARETLHKEHPFAFTHDLLDKTVDALSQPEEGRSVSGATVIATVLNGYETRNPFGKQVQRAEVIVLSSSIDKAVRESIERVVRSAYHTHELRLTGFAQVAYSVVRTLFPHERDALVLDVSANATEIALIRHGLLADTVTIECGLAALRASALKAARDTAIENNAHPGVYRLDTISSDAEKEWIELVHTALSGFAAHNALPRTLFLLSDDNSSSFVEHLFDNSSLHALWLSDEPLHIIPVTAAETAACIRSRENAEADLALAFLALYEQRCTYPSYQIEGAAKH